MITFRLSYALTPEFTIQYYGSPYISMGKYEGFKTLADHDTEDPDKVFHTFSENEIKYDESTRKYAVYEGIIPNRHIHLTIRISISGNSAQTLLQGGNTGPDRFYTLYGPTIVTSDENITNNNIGYNFSRLFNEPAMNVFLIKFSYWFSR